MSKAASRPYTEGREVAFLPLVLVPYDRAAAVSYAHQWAYGRNPAFYDYEKLGGDCTNFASQCVYAGSGVMNYTPTYGWYYINANDKAPAWTGVEYFYRFITRTQPSQGPVAQETDIRMVQPGDVVQISFDGSRFSHTPVVVAAPLTPTEPSQILIAAHSYDADNRPLSTYEYKKLRFLHIRGVLRPVQ